MFEKLLVTKYHMDLNFHGITLLQTADFHIFAFPFSRIGCIILYCIYTPYMCIRKAYHWRAAPRSIAQQMPFQAILLAVYITHT